MLLPLHYQWQILIQRYVQCENLGKCIKVKRNCSFHGTHLLYCLITDHVV